MLAIIGIITGISGDGFSQLLNNVRTQEISDSLRNSINYARSESITHGGNVRLCGSQNGTNCAATFDTGWLVYHDVDADGALTTADRLLLWERQEHAGLTVSSVDSGGATTSAFGFNHRGYPTSSLTLGVVSNSLTVSLRLHNTGRIENL